MMPQDISAWEYMENMCVLLLYHNQTDYNGILSTEIVHHRYCMTFA